MKCAVCEKNITEYESKITGADLCVLCDTHDLFMKPWNADELDTNDFFEIQKQKELISEVHDILSEPYNTEDILLEERIAHRGGHSALTANELLNFLAEFLPTDEEDSE